MKNHPSWCKKTHHGSIHRQSYGSSATGSWVYMHQLADQEPALHVVRPEGLDVEDLTIWQASAVADLVQPHDPQLARLLRAAVDQVLAADSEVPQ